MTNPLPRFSRSCVAGEATADDAETGTVHGAFSSGIRAAREAIAAFGRVDVWVNNAGRGINRPVLELTEQVAAATPAMFERLRAAHPSPMAALRASGVPVMLYDVPGRTATTIELETYEAMRRYDHVTSVKDATGLLPRTAELANMGKRTPKVFSQNCAISWLLPFSCRKSLEGKPSTTRPRPR